MSRLFIAEKASLAEAVWSVLPGTPTRKGAATLVGSDWFVPLAGHILEQAMPDEYLPDDVPRTKAGAKQWRAQDLPIVPVNWIMHPRSSGDDEQARERDRRNNEMKLATIADLLKNVDEVVHLGDPDAEGQLLVDEVLLLLNNTKPVLRLLVNDPTPACVREALTVMRSNDEPAFRAWYIWALARSRYDWVFGLNSTRAATLRARELSYDNVLTVGRVQTPTLRLVVDRDLQIERFKPIPFFSLSATFEHVNGAFKTRWKARDDQAGLDEAGRLVDAREAAALVARIKGAPATITAFEKKERKERPPLPMSLNELMVSACVRFECTAEEVLDAAQALYEKKLTSYPRTEVRYLSEAQRAVAPAVMGAIKGNLPALTQLVERADTSAPASQAFDDKKMKDANHHGLVPTDGTAELSSLTDLQRGIYAMVVGSYLAQFFPEAVFLQTKIELECAGERFVSGGKTPVSAGWREVYAPCEEGSAAAADADTQDDERQMLPPMVQGDPATCGECEAASRETRPPARFDESGLIAAMTDLHRYTTDENARKRLKEGNGIGTSATRSGIIKELRRRGFLEPYRNSKTKLVSTPAGRALIAALPAALSDPTMAGQFQIELDRIATGEQTYDRFMEVSTQFVTKLVTFLRTAPMTLPVAQAVPCPKCGTGQLRLRKSDKGPFWGCSNWQAEPKCDAHYPDVNGKPGQQTAARKKGFGFKKVG